MSDILKIIENLRNSLWARFGNPLSNYKKTQDDIHMTYYVGRLMEELGHKYVSPENIKGEHEDRVHYSENALHDAFLAGRLLSRVENKKNRANILAELKSEMHDLIDQIRLTP